MDSVNEKLVKILNVEKKEENANKIINHISSLNSNRIQTILNQISNVNEPPLIFIRLNSELNEEEQVNGRIISMDENFRPLKSKIIIKDEDKSVFKGETDNLGTLEFKFPFNKKNYEINAISNGNKKTLLLNLSSKQEEYVCYIMTDRDNYMPGQKILLRFLLWKLLGSSYKPSNEKVKVTLIDPKSNILLIREVFCDTKFGVGELQIPIAEEAIEGDYNFNFSVKDFETQKIIHIMHYIPPDIELTVNCEPTYLKIGEYSKLTLNSKYFYNAPVKGGQAKLEIISPSGEKILETHGETDENGNFEYLFKVPETEEGEAKIKIELKDTLKRTASKELKIKLLKRVLKINAETNKTIEPGQEAEVIIKAEIPSLDGKFVPLNNCLILASINDTELNHHAKFEMGKTDEAGRCSIIFEIDYPTEKKKNFDINLIIESEKINEIKKIRKGLTVQKMEIKDEKKANKLPKIWLNSLIDYSNLDKKNFIKLKVSIKRKKIPVYIDVEKENVIYRTAKLIKSECSEIQIPVTRKMWGNIKVIAYAFRENGILEKNEKIIHINPKHKELKVEIETDKEVYQPGNKANFKISILQDKEMVASCLGVVLVDAAVLQLGRKLENPLEIFFKKEFTKKKIKEVKTWDFIEYNNYFNLLMDALILHISSNLKDLAIVLEFLKIAQNTRLLNSEDFKMNYEKILTLIRNQAKNVKKQNNKTLMLNILKILSQCKPKLKDIKVIEQVVEEEIVKISDKNVNLYKKIIFDIFRAENEGFIDRNQKKELLLKIHEYALKAAFNKESALYLELESQLNDMLSQIEDKEPVKTLIQNFNLKFKSLRKVTPKEFKPPSETSVVLELGTDLSYIGYVGEDKPRSIIPTLIGYPKYTSIMADVNHYTREYYIGEEAMHLGGGGGKMVVKTTSSGFKKEYKKTLGLIYTPSYEFKSITGAPSVVRRCFDGPTKETLANVTGNSLNQNPYVSVRFFFPETSLWIPYMETREGEAIIETELPDQITSHELNVVASTEDCEAGMGTHRILVKQDFFIKLDTPQILTHGDNIEVNLILTNLSEDNLRCHVNINPDKEILNVEFLKDEILVPANGMSRLELRLKALSPGESIIWIEAKTPKYIDVIRKKIKVNPKGEPHIYRYTGLIMGDNSVNIYPQILEDTIYTKAYLTLIPGYQMGCIDGLETILGYPHGCTEQTMAKFLPNIYIYELLKSRNKLNNELQNRIDEYILKGVQQLIRLRNKAGGWGYWENKQSDPYITAHVLFGLVTAKNSGFYIDEEIIRNTIKELENIQSKNGSWNSNRNNNTFCTAYVLQALLEAKKGNFVVNQEKFDRGIKYILKGAKTNSDIINDPTSLSHLIMVLIENGAESDKDKLDFLTKRLYMLAKNEKDFIFWDKGSALASNVESTAYSALAFHRAKVYSIMVQKALNYIMSQRAKEGGWSTTSDTVAAIRCLIECVQSEKVNYKIKSFFNTEVIKEFSVNEESLENIIYDMRKIPLNNIEKNNHFIIEKKGEGLLVYDLSIETWHSEEYLLKPKILTIYRDFSSQKISKNEAITVTLRVDTTEEQGMFVIEETTPAGFLIFEPSIDKLIEDRKIVSYKLSNEKLYLYLEELKRSINLDYKMIATKAGEVTAKETVVYPMYNVSLKANSKLKTLKIN